MLIGEVARAAGMTVEGLRFYERRGLLPPPTRSPGGYRLYAADALDRLGFIRQAQGIGLSLDEIRRILLLSRAGVAPCQEVQAFVRGKVAEVDRRLRELKALRRRLGATLARWETGGTPSRGAHACGLIEATGVELTSARTPTAAARSRSRRARRPAAGGT